MRFEIYDVDYWENDAMIAFVPGDRHYFQFSEDATIETAIWFLAYERKSSSMPFNMTPEYRWYSAYKAYNAARNPAMREVWSKVMDSLQTQFKS